MKAPRGPYLTLVALVLTLAVRCAAEQRSADGADELTARIDARWEHRDAHGAVPDMVTLAALLLAIEPQSYEAEWRIARAYFWAAYTQPSRLFKKALAVKSIEWAERARQHEPERVEGHYFYAIAVGQYATTIGLGAVVSEGVAGKVERAAQRAAELGPDFERGAPEVVLGRYYFSLPWPLRDLQRSRRYLEGVVARHPDSLIARCYLAETYHALDEDDLARAQLSYVLGHERPKGTDLDLPDPKVFARDALREWFD